MGSLSTFNAGIPTLGFDGFWGANRRNNNRNLPQPAGGHYSIILVHFNATDAQLWCIAQMHAPKYSITAQPTHGSFSTFLQLPDKRQCCSAAKLLLRISKSQTICCFLASICTILFDSQHYIVF
jgi:hypothetical protein